MTLTCSTVRLPADIRAVLFDMDGVLYDSMPRHARAWMDMCAAHGLDATDADFYLNEGRTGAATIDMLMMRQYGRHTSPEEAARLYAVKSARFAAQGPAPLMPGALEAVAEARATGVAVLVTGSGQESLLEKLSADFGGAFAEELRVTAHDVRHGKPDPEPYLAGLAKAAVRPDQAVAVDNAPLGVQSAHRAGIFTIGVRTGPIRPGTLLEAGADIELAGMREVARLLHSAMASKR